MVKVCGPLEILPWDYGSVKRVIRVRCAASPGRGGVAHAPGRAVVCGVCARIVSPIKPEFELVDPVFDKPEDLKILLDLIGEPECEPDLVSADPDNKPECEPDLVSVDPDNKPECEPDLVSVDPDNKPECGPDLVSVDPDNKPEPELEVRCKPDIDAKAT